MTSDITLRLPHDIRGGATPMERIIFVRIFLKLFSDFSPLSPPPPSTSEITRHPPPHRPLENIRHPPPHRPPKNIRYLPSIRGPRGRGNR